MNHSNGLPTADPYLTGHGDPSHTVTHYDLDLAVALGANRLDGTARLAVRTVQPTRRLVWDLAHLRVAKVKADVGVKGFRQVGHRLVVDLKKELAAGTELTCEISYSGRPRQLRDRHHDLAGWEELEDGVIVAAQPHGAPTWFPCNDQMREKSTYSVKVRTDADYRAVANGELTSHTRHGSGETWHWSLDVPVAPYLATLQIGRYRAWPVTGSSVPIEVCAPADLDAARCADSFGRQAQMMEVFTDLFGPYPFSGYRTVVTDDVLEIPLESASLSTFGRNFADGAWQTERLIAHELSHQWFGNSVTAAAMQHIWLHEGFACYAEWLWSERSGRESADAHARAHHGRLEMPPSTAARPVVLADPGPEEMFNDWVYKRGALALHTLRQHVGDEAFFALLRDWAQEHRAGIVDTEEFLSFASAATGADVALLLHPWLLEHDLPPLPER